jgi:threonine synthase
VSDASVYALQARLASEEGIFSEPAGAVALAGALQAAAAGEIDHDAHLVCVVTGSGFKDGASLARMADTSRVPLVEFGDFSNGLRRSG